MGFSIAAQGAPVDQQHAIAAAKRWHALAPNPMKGRAGEIGGAKTYSNAGGEARFHVVSLKPAGFVVMAADDEVEPVLAFGLKGQFVGKAGNPLYDLLLKDTETRIHRARLDIAAKRPASAERLRAKAKWAMLTAGLTADLTQAVTATGTTVDDVCVAPLVQSEWSQSTTDSGTPMYNYYTPGPNLYATPGSANNYVCGCVATAMAQLMRYWQWPQGAVGTASYTVTVDGTSVQQALRGGNGAGGAYDWADMVLVPGSAVTTQQCQAIGALTADAAASVNMAYDEGGTDESGANPSAAGMRSTFQYANASSLYYGSIAQYLSAIRPNLDAGQPVMLSISGPEGGHEVVCDGYGYTAGTIYHHLNVGWGPYWAGLDDIWYNLPTIDPPESGYTFGSVDAVYYNINPTATGEIISGRLTQANGTPVSGMLVTLTGATVLTATTNAEGIYAFTGVPSNTNWVVVPSGGGAWAYSPSQQSVTTGQSTDDGPTGDQIADFTAQPLGAGPFTVTPSAGANGTIAPNAADVVSSGSNVTFTATPAAGYVVNQWLVNNTVEQTSGTSFTLYDVASNQSVEVTFTPEAPVPAQMVSPAPGATLTSSTATFQWNPGFGNTAFYLYLGSTQGGVDIFISGSLSATTTSASVTGIPVDGRTIYAQLWSFNSNTGYQYANYTYTAADTPILSVRILPAAAVSAGAKWNVDGGTWQNSGALISGLAAESHRVNFSTVAGYSTPASQTVTLNPSQLTSLTGTYVPPEGSLCVTLSPPGAAAAGAEWQVDSGPLQESGATVSGLAIGNEHIVTFTTPPGFYTPNPNFLQVNINANQMTTATITFSQMTELLSVTIYPAAAVSAGAQWNVDGGAWQSSGAAVSGLTVGNHTINFSAVAGYATPASENATVAFGLPTVMTGYYTGIPVISLEEPVGSPLASGSSTVDFGTGFIQGKETLLFAIHNYGASTLAAQGVTISGSNASDFSAGLYPIVNVAPGQSVPFGVTFNPASLGSRSAVLGITTNDPVTPLFSVALTGSGISTSELAGAYAGLLDNNDGALSMTVNKKGLFTGRLMISGSGFGLRGSFDGNGNYTASLGRAQVALALHLGWDQIDGTAAGIPVTAWRSAYSAGETITEAGAYTALLNVAESGTAAPGGTGYGTMSVSKTGKVALNGKLSDGTKFSTGAVIVAGSTGDEIPVYLPKLTSGGEMLAGTIAFEYLAQSNCDGALEWCRPKQTGTSGYYPEGFDAVLDFSGSIYKAPAHGSAALPFSSGMVELSGGGIADAITDAVSLMPSGQIAVSDANPNAVKLSVKTATGLLGGSFVHPATKKTVKFGGVLYQNAANPCGAGYFLMPVSTGTAPSGGIMVAPTQ